jgi:hypothetical protein
MEPVPLADVPVPVPDAGGWDAGLWDAALWGSGTGISGAQYGTAGMGTAIAIVLRGTSISNTTLVSIDALVDSGWYL